MASDLGDLAVKIGADNKEYIAAMAASKQAVAEFARSNDLSLGEASQVLRRFAKDSSDASKEIKSNWESIGGAAEAMVGVVVAAIAAAIAGLVEFGESAVDAANLMDPKGADAWYASVQKLKDAWVTFAGTIGKDIRPQLEELMDLLVKLIHYADTIDFSKVIADMQKLGQAVMLAVSPMQTLAGLLGKITGEAIGGSQAFQDMAGNAAKAVSEHYQKNGAEGSSGPTSDDHFKDAAEIRAAGAAQLRGLKEEGKAERERAQAAAANYAKAVQVAEIEKQAAKTSFDMSNKTMADKLALLQLQKSADESSEKVAAANLVAAQAAADAFNSKHNEGKDAAAYRRNQQILESPAGKSPEALAKADVASKAFLAEQADRLKLQSNLAKAQTEADKSHLQSVKDADAIKVNEFDTQRQASKDELEATMSAAQFAYDMSSKSYSDEMDLLTAKRNLAIAEQKTAADANAAALKVTEASNELLKAQKEHNDQISASVEGMGRSALGPAGKAIDLGKAVTGSGGDPMVALAGLATDILMASSAFKTVQQVLQPFIQAFSDVAGIIVLLQSGLLPIIIILGVLSPIFELLSAAIQAFLDVITGPGKVVGEVFQAIIAPVKALGEAVKAAVDGIVMGPLNQLADIGKSLMAPLEQFAKALQSFVGEPGAAVILGLTQLGKIFGYLSESFTRAAQIFNPFRAVVETLVQALASSFGPIIGKLGNGLQAVASIMQATLVPVLPLIEKMFKDVADMFSGPIGAAIGSLFDAAMQFASFTMSVVQGIDTVIYTVLQTINDVLYAMNGVAKALGLDKQLSQIEGTVGDAYNAAKTGAYDAGIASQAFAGVTWKGTSALIALATAADAANTQLTNLPASFNVAQAYNQAIAAGAVTVGQTVGGSAAAAASAQRSADEAGHAGSGYEHDALIRRRGGSGGSNGTVINIQNLTVEASDPMQLFDDLANLNSAQGNGSTLAPQSRSARQELAFR